MKYFDLNIQKTEAIAPAKTLGFSNAILCKVIRIEKQEEFKSVGKKLDGEIISIESQNPELLRQACKKNVNLICPVNSPAYYNDEGLIRALIASNASAKEFEEKEKAFELPISALLQSSHVNRAKHLWQFRRFISKCMKLKAPVILTSRASNEFEVKSPREFIAIGQVLGMSYEKAQYCISTQCEKII